MAILSSFLRFLSEGNLGTIDCGTSIKDIELKLGLPDGICKLKSPDGLIYKYGSVQLSFINDSLSLIVIDVFDELSIVPGLLSEDVVDFIIDNRPIELWDQFLRNNDIIFSKDENLSFEDQITLKIEGGCYLIFDENNCLESIQFRDAPLINANQGKVEEK